MMKTNYDMTWIVARRGKGGGGVPGTLNVPENIYQIALTIRTIFVSNNIVQNKS